MEFPLSITTTSENPYDDGKMEDGYLIYKYRGININHRDNVGLRECMKRNLPLIYLHSIITSKYVPFWPVYIVGDDPSSLSFKVGLDDFESVNREKGRIYESDARRIYLTSTIRVQIASKRF